MKDEVSKSIGTITTSLFLSLFGSRLTTGNDDDEVVDAERKADEK